MYGGGRTPKCEAMSGIEASASRGQRTTSRSVGVPLRDALRWRPSAGAR